MGYPHSMVTLAFDTCFAQLSAAVRYRMPDGTWRVHGETRVMATGHAEHLLPMIETVLREAGVRFPDIERIAVTLGPGTFTGVRTGIAAARALALAAGKPVAGLTSLSLLLHTALAQNPRELAGKPLAVAVDARRGEVYLQLFDPQGEPAGDPQLLTLAAALALLPAETAVLGSGGPLLRALATTEGFHIDAILPDLQPDARTLASLADQLPIINPVHPLYLRAPDAKPQTGKSLPRAP